MQFVVDSFDLMHGGELYVPRIPSMKITDLAQAIAPGAPMHDVGLRPGEKLHEEMISPEEGRRALRLGDRYFVQPDLGTWGYRPPETASRCTDGFSYRSDSNDQWYTRERDHRDPGVRDLTCSPTGGSRSPRQDVEAVAAVLRGDWLTTGPTVDAFEEAVSGAGRRPPGVVSCTSGHRGAAHRLRGAGARARRRGGHHADDLRGHRDRCLAAGRRGRLRRRRARTPRCSTRPRSTRPVTDRTRVVAAVDYAGHPCDYDALQPAGRPGRGRAPWPTPPTPSAAATTAGPSGDLADVTTLSFFPTKNLTTAEGGAVVASDPDRRPAGRASSTTSAWCATRTGSEIADEGPWHQEVHEFGLNYRLTDLACALGLCQLRRLEQFKQRRAEITARYNAALADVDGRAHADPRRGHVDPVWHLYPLRVLDGRRREVFDKMREAGHRRAGQLPPRLLAPGLRRTSATAAACAPTRRRSTREELSLPLFPDLTDDQVDQVVETLEDILR